MITDYKIDIYNRLLATKVGGITIPGALSFVKTVDCDLQPYSKALLMKQYGYNLEVSKMFFMDSDDSVKIGSIFYYTNSQDIIEKYEVKAIPWDTDYLEVVCLGI